MDDREKEKRNCFLYSGCDLGSILMSVLAVAGAAINSSLLRGQEASIIALQSRILAETKYDLLKHKGYNKLAHEEGAAINGSPYERKCCPASILPPGNDSGKWLIGNGQLTAG
ncbi:MAG: hypothetical protein ACRDBM_01585 [Sporomusa sp.]